jgi:hypothetical protein
VQTKLAKSFGEILGALLFRERSGGNRADAYLFFGNRGGVRLEKTQRVFDLRQGRELSNRQGRGGFERGRQGLYQFQNLMFFENAVGGLGALVNAIDASFVGFDAALLEPVDHV